MIRDNVEIKKYHKRYHPEKPKSCNLLIVSVIEGIISNNNKIHIIKVNIKSIAIVIRVKTESGSPK